MQALDREVKSGEISNNPESLPDLDPGKHILINQYIVIGLYFSFLCGVYRHSGTAWLSNRRGLNTVLASSVQDGTLGSLR
jgi:hypothetical protein